MTAAETPLAEADSVPVQAGTPDVGFGVYVHWPFCKAKCPYCDFNSHVRHSGVDQADFAQALADDVAAMAARTPERRVTSIFFGGGTPSLMAPRTVDTVLSSIADRWQMAPHVEVTLEANPTSVEAENFAAYRTAGVNRVSVGVQSLDDRALKFLGRQHTAAEALEAVAAARRAFERVSFDLIYARPGQTSHDWREELARALALGPDHISAYQLTIEPETAFFDLQERGALEVPDDDAAADLYGLTQELCGAAGLAAYEVSNYAAPGARSRHNLLYWRYGEYAGIGPGAHSRLVEDGVRRAIDAIRSPEEWRAAIAQGHSGHSGERVLTPDECADEMLLMGLRLSEGVSLKRLAQTGGQLPARDAIAALVDLGMLRHDEAGARIVATAEGRLVLNSVIAALCS